MARKLYPYARKHNLFGEILAKGHDEDYQPSIAPQPTKERPGSKGKLEELARRVERGEQLWHEMDEVVACTKEEDTEKLEFLSVVRSRKRI